MNETLQNEGRTRRGFIISALGFGLLFPSYGAVLAAGRKQRFVITIKGGLLPRDKQTIRVSQGDAVEIEFTSDTALSLHLHGLNIEISLTPGNPAVMSFDARVAGRFPVEAHGKGAHSNLMYVEIYP